MLITPKFELSQTDDQIILIVHTPYCNYKKAEVNIEDENIHFFCSPYNLRLTLPGRLKDDGESGEYDISTDKFTIKIDKVRKGEHFHQLEMLTSLMVHQKKQNIVKPIEVISSTTEDPENEKLTEADWFMEQEIDESLGIVPNHSYGFLNSHSGLETKFEEELIEICENVKPDSTSTSERTSQRILAQQSKFSDDHYLCDLFDEGFTTITDMVKFEFPFDKLSNLDSQDREDLKNLANREFLINSKWQKRLILGIVDILFAYVYDLRINLGKHCVESPWNYSRLSATLSWFHVYDAPSEVVDSCFKRSLSYPLIRRWTLTRRSFKDALHLIKLGPVVVLKCLLDIRRQFNAKSPFYLLNLLYLDEYSVWIQKVDPQTLGSVIKPLEEVLYKYKKEDTNLDLIELEIAAKSVIEEEEMEAECQQMSNKMKNVQIN